MAIPKQSVTDLSRRRLPTVTDLCLLLAALLAVALSWHGLPDGKQSTDIGRSARAAVSEHFSSPPPRSAQEPNAR